MSDNYTPGGSHPSAPGNAVTLPYLADTQLDLGGPEIQGMTLGGNLTLTARNHAAGQRLDLLLTADASERNLNFPTAWNFVGTKPTNIAASKVGRLTLLVNGVTDAGVVASWSVQT